MDAGFTACVSRHSCLKPRHTDGKRGLRLLTKPRFTDFSVEPRLTSSRDGTKPRLKCGPTAWGVGDKLGSSERRKWVEPRLTALVGPVYIRDRSFKGFKKGSLSSGVERNCLWWITQPIEYTYVFSFSHDDRDDAKKTPHDDFYKLS